MDITFYPNKAHIPVDYKLSTNLAVTCRSVIYTFSKPYLPIYFEIFKIKAIMQKLLMQYFKSSIFFSFLF